MIDPLARFRLDDRVAIITGGSRGLGREMVHAFASVGCNVVIASRKIENCQALAVEVEERFGVAAVPYACNVGNWEELGPLVDAVYERFGKADVLVNNAGMSPLFDSIEDISEALYDKVFAVNLKGAFRLSALVGSRMAALDGGSIINVSSGAAVNSQPHIVPYAAAKAGLNSITVGFARTFGPKVRVNCIMAGPFLTDISKAWDLEAFHARAAENFALGRGGQPNEIVGAALYFASDASSFTTGSVLAVDGGL